MCICCCETRKSLLISAIIISILSIIYGIITVSQFGHKSFVYKYLKAKLDSYDAIKDTLSPYDYPDYRILESYDFSSLSYEDLSSIDKIEMLDYDDLKFSHNILNKLKGIENGLGVVLLVFSFLFLAGEIVFLFFIRGSLENQLLRVKLFSILNGFKVLNYTLSIIFIFLSISYGILLTIALLQYYLFVPLIDSCSRGIWLGIGYGYYSFWIYITLSCIFGKERRLFIEVGSQDNPGARAQYDINGNVIVRTVPVTQVVGYSPQVLVQPMTMPYQQIPVYNYNNVQVPSNIQVHQPSQILTNQSQLQPKPQSENQPQSHIQSQTQIQSQMKNQSQEQTQPQNQPQPEPQQKIQILQNNNISSSRSLHNTQNVNNNQ